MQQSQAASLNQRFSWFSIIRLGLVQACLGAIVVLTTSTLNRVMVVELSLAATIPGLLVGLHYAVQITRPLWGHGSDKGGSRSLWIVLGMMLLALAGTGASATTLLIEQSFWQGMIAATFCYALIGFGIGAAGTSLLALLASHTAPARRPAAATIVWIMMIAGIVITAATTGAMLDPYSHMRLVTITAITGLIAVTLTTIALFGLERRHQPILDNDNGDQAIADMAFSARLRETWADPKARLFTIFVFMSMLAYSTQDLILEPFAGLLFGMTPGETTQLSGTQHGGVLIGMILVGALGSIFAKHKAAMLKNFAIIGCVGSGLSLMALAVSASFAPLWPLKVNVFLLGLTNGMFTIAAIGTMMALAGGGKGRSEGIRMGVWGAAQAIAFGLGGFMGTVAVDISRLISGSVPFSFAIVFMGEAILFFISAAIAARIATPETKKISHALNAQPHSYTNLQPAE